MTGAGVAADHPRPVPRKEQAIATIVSSDMPSLGGRSYLPHDGQVALVVDPQRDIDRVLDIGVLTGGSLLIVAAS